MLHHRILIVSADAGVRRSLRRLMTATGAATEFVPSLAKLPAEPPSLLCADLRPGSGLDPGDLATIYPGVRLICVVGGQDFGRMVDCLALARCGSVITCDDRFEPEDFVITVTKLLHGQVFGLQKYFPWGVTLYNMEIGSYDEKIEALDVLNGYAELAGARGPVRDRMALVAEELIINAMYHAPADANGKPLYRHLPRKELAKRAFARSVKVQCASNGQHFAVAVRDQYGTLDKATIVQFLGKGKASVLEPENRASGAGLGLVTALKSANRLIFNLSPGIGSEVIALFDLDLMAKGQSGVRAVHIFTERRKEMAKSSPPRRARAPIALAALALLVVVLGVVAAVQPFAGRAVAPVSTTVQVGDGQSREVPLRIGTRDVRLRIERNGSELRLTTAP